VIGVSRRRPDGLTLPEGVELAWIEADLAEPLPAARWIEQQAPAQPDVLIYNLGVWEANAFSEAYNFLEDPDESIASLVAINITGALMLLRRLIPRLLCSPPPADPHRLHLWPAPERAAGGDLRRLQVRPHRHRRCPAGELPGPAAGGDLPAAGLPNTDDGLEVPPEAAARRGQGRQIPLHDVTFVRELVLPAMGDERF
jgi:NAD(P)-dependent dehydrogenase (short-subunit alcohol dehydrogenase family)